MVAEAGLSYGQTAEFMCLGSANEPFNVRD